MSSSTDPVRKPSYAEGDQPRTAQMHGSCRHCGLDILFIDYLGWVHRTSRDKFCQTDVAEPMEADDE